MPRARKWPPTVYPHVSGRDRIRVNGIDYWLGPTGSVEARKEYARLVVELAGSDGQPPPRLKAHAWPTVAELVKLWRLERMPSCALKEAAQFVRALEVLLLGGRAELRTDQIEVAELDAARRDMVTLGWCANHINRQVVRIRTVWRWAEKLKHAPKGSWNHLRTLEPIAGSDHSVRRTERTRPADLAELLLILPRIRSRSVKAMLLLQRHTGMRSGEVRTMRAGEVDQSADVWIYRPRKHKMSHKGQLRVIPIGPEGQAVLAPFLAHRKPEERVFRTRNGTPVTSNGYALIAQRAARKVGLPWFRPYCLRHGAKQRLTREYGLDVARAVLGQKSIGTTNDYGDALDLDAAVRALRKAG